MVVARFEQEDLGGSMGHVGAGLVARIMVSNAEEVLLLDSQVVVGGGGPRSFATLAV